MTHVVIVGGGHAGMQVASALRGNGFDGAITVVHGEPGWPYQRPPLTKSYLRGETVRERFALSSEERLARDAVTLRPGRVAAIDRTAHTLLLDDGDNLRYDRLVLALGSRSRRLPVPGHDLAGVVTLRTLADADALRQELDRAHDVVVIGGGYIGLEFAANAGRPVTVLEARERILARTSSSEVAEHVEALHARHGATIRTAASLVAFQGNDSVQSIRLDDGTEIPADLVLVAVGIMPNCELAEASGLAVEDGILVDEHLTTHDSRVMAVGDCARFWHERLGRRLRLESVHNAVGQARAVADTIAGRAAAYTATPASWSEQFGTRIQTAGLPDPEYERVVSPARNEGGFSVLSFDGDELAAVESVDAPADHVAALRLLDGPSPITRDQIEQVGYRVTDVAAPATVSG